MPTKKQGLQHLEKPNPLSREPYWLRRSPQIDEETTGTLGQITGILRRRAAIIASTAVITTTVAIALTSQQVPKYEGKFQLLVEPLKTSESELLVLLSQTLQQDVNKITRDNTTALDYQALMEVLKSPKVIEPVVDKLQSQYPEVSYGKLVGGSSPKIASIQDGKLHIVRLGTGDEESRVIEVSYRDSNPDKVQRVLDLVSQAYRKYSIEQQQTNLRQGIKFVEQQIPKLRLRVNTLQNQLQVFQQRYGVFNPELQGEQLLRRSDELQSTRQDTLKQLAEAKSVYASRQNQLGMQPDSAIAASALSESPQYQEILKRVREVEARIATESVRLSDANPVMVSLREERQKLLPLLQAEARRALGFNISSPELDPQVTTYQNSVRRDLIQNMAQTANQIQLLQASLEATNQAIKQINQQVQEYPVVARQYANVQRELQVATDTLNQLLSKQEALRVEAAQQDVPWELIMPPRLPRNQAGEIIPTGSNSTRDIALGAVAGLLLGTLGAFILENMRNVYHDPEEVKRAAKLPLLGAIPFQKKFHKPALPPAKELVHSLQTDTPKLETTLVKVNKPQQHKESELAQAFCSLFTRVKALKEETAVCSIGVTSAYSGEGKSTVAVNLAQIAAKAGQKVLLIDADLQNPQVHKKLGLVNTRGLSEILSQGLDLDHVIGQSPTEENLYVVTAGEICENPAKLFASPGMKNLIEQSQAQFDLVVYDTPHLMGRLDTNALINYIDGIVFVVGLGKTVRPSLIQALEELKASRTRILGMVTNAIEA